MSGFPLVHAFGAALVDHALGIAEYDVVGLYAHRLRQFGTGDGGSARAVDDDLDVFHPASGEVDGVDEAGRGDDRGAMLIIMEHGKVHRSEKRRVGNEWVSTCRYRGSPCQSK